jgi:aryl-alcohol dehydrogenase-like predicted oxidoreductase
VMRAMTDILRCGRATAWGTSEWSAQQITEAFWMARQFGKQVPGGISRVHIYQSYL